MKLAFAAKTSEQAPDANGGKVMEATFLKNVYEVNSGEFQTAGDASANIKRKLKQISLKQLIGLR